MYHVMNCVSSRHGADFGRHQPGCQARLWIVHRARFCFFYYRVKLYFDMYIHLPTMPYANLVKGQTFTIHLGMVPTSDDAKTAAGHVGCVAQQSVDCSVGELSIRCCRVQMYLFLYAN